MRDIPIKAKYYIAILSLVALLLFAYLVHVWGFIPSGFIIVIFFLIVNAAAESLPVRMPNGVSVTVSFATILASIILLSPPEVVLIAVLGYLFSIGKNSNYMQYVFNSAQLVLSSGLSALVFRLLIPNIPTENLSINVNVLFVLALAVSSLVYILINTFLVAMILGFVNGTNPYAFWFSNMKWSVGNFLAMAPLGLLIALIHSNVNELGVILFLIPLLLARHSFKSYMDMRRSFLDTIESLITAIDAKDSYTRGHSSRVADYAVAIGRELGYNDVELENFKFIALLHDAGKIGIKEHILNKPAALSFSEFQEMQRHPVIGAEIVKNVKMLKDGGVIIRHHHERFDGGGYPEGIKGDDIPEGARIIGVADAFDAMTSDRPYRRALTTEEALRELTRCSGSQFDPRIVAAFVKGLPGVTLSAGDQGVLQAMQEAAAAAEEPQVTDAKRCRGEKVVT